MLNKKKTTSRKKKLPIFTILVYNIFFSNDLKLCYLENFCEVWEFVSFICNLNLVEETQHL
jgi:hypothetical protein